MCREHHTTRLYGRINPPEGSGAQGSTLALRTGPRRAARALHTRDRDPLHTLTDSALSPVLQTVQIEETRELQYTHTAPTRHSTTSVSACPRYPDYRLRLHRGRRCASERVLTEAFAAGRPQDLVD